MNRTQLIAYSLRYAGSTARIARALQRNEAYQPSSQTPTAVTILDANYPVRLKKLAHPPYVLFLDGDVDCLSDVSIGVVGSRQMQAYAARSTQALIASLPKHWVVVSGMARGVDGCAHEAALNQGLRTVAVLGHGLDLCYPREHHSLFKRIAAQGCLVSQYPPRTPLEKFRFVERNHVIAALSDALCVMQAGEKSGTMSTVNAALECGIDVHCLPYRIDEVQGLGNNRLIQQGAYILTKVDELIKL
jgi:DNA processing protein